MKNPVMSVGVINIQSGKTSDGWSIYENKGLEAYLTNGGFLLMNPKTWKEDLKSEMVRLIKLKDDEHRANVANIESNIQAQINSTEVDKYIEEFLDN